ncbi:hypothetical protein [Oceanobacillus neutriphilus]|uniref:DUF3139 domain-containing protein n=1 Tax=Oceanobacillus neutriphilus TaxID=531815 RepID=A0ABQ2P356_9BACI|nr:hypothetical protein [Oceanobacillus neutriphilus]GGP16830.1 hypothetical protein GCM10011346_50360 [Oceanobacillus neutriphilus]
MKKYKLLLIFLFFSLAIITCIIVYNSIFNQTKLPDSPENNSEVIDLEVEKEEIRGYYYDGFLDQREKFTEEDEVEYFYHMDNYFRNYYNDFFAITGESDEKDNYSDYFEKIRWS